MAELEQVERLREKANVTFAEAKEALDAANGDILDALIYLENQGKATIPAGGGYFSSAGGAASAGTAAPEHDAGRGDAKRNGESFWDMLKRFGKFCLKLLNKGNNNFLDATRGGEAVFSCPVTAVVVLLLCFFYLIIPLFIISLFCGYRYRFRGADLGRDSVNRVMDSASDVVEDVKRSFSENEDK